MRVLVGLILLALLVTPGTPVTAETGDEETGTTATAMVRTFLTLPFVPLTFDLLSLEIADSREQPIPDMTGGCDPVGGVNVSPNGGGGAGGCSGGDPPGGGGGGGTGG